MVLCVLIQGLLPNSGGLLNDIGEKVTEGKELETYLHNYISVSWLTNIHVFQENPITQKFILISLEIRHSGKTLFSFKKSCSHNHIPVILEIHENDCKLFLLN